MRKAVSKLFSKFFGFDRGGFDNHEPQGPHGILSQPQIAVIVEGELITGQPGEAFQLKNGKLISL